MGLFLRRHDRHKNGKDYTYWSLVESQRTSAGKIFQRQVFYLGELSQAQQQAWESVAEQIDWAPAQTPELNWQPATKSVPSLVVPVPQIHFSRFTLHNPRQWGACWIADRLWQDLRCNEFWRPHLPQSREGTQWLQILQTLVSYRLIDPGSEFRLHREWFAHSAMADILGVDESLAAKDNLYRCLDKLLAHKDALFVHLQNRWKDLFGAQFEVLLYDLTSTYFESDPPQDTSGKRRFGYSRDKRSDCVQVIIALVITPEGFPLAYDVLPGNTADKATLKLFLKKLRRTYGKAQRTWVMDRGIPTEESLEIMRKKRHRMNYLVGTPKGQLTKLESQLVGQPWQQARPDVTVKLLKQSQETYVYVQSHNRVAKERSMRRRKLKALWSRLKVLQQMKLKRDQLLVKLGQAREKAGRVYRLVDIVVPENSTDSAGCGITFSLNKRRLREMCKREGRYLLRTNMEAKDPAQLWEMYLRLVEIEEAFRDLKSDLQVRPIFHWKETRIEAHIFVAFMAYCLHVCLKGHLRKVAGGLTPRAVLAKFVTMQLVDVHLPMDTGQELVLTRRTQPDTDQRLLLRQLGWNLPEQPPPRITHDRQLEG
jgi:transposase